MKRKRFIKLLMARGIPRNEANHIADIVRCWDAWKRR